jgi:hypothetical protein
VSTLNESQETKRIAEKLREYKRKHAIFSKCSKTAFDK